MDEIEDIILHADSDSLLLGLVKRGATTRPVAGNMVKVTLRLPKSKVKVKPERAKSSRRFSYDLDPDLKL